MGSIPEGDVTLHLGDFVGVDIGYCDVVVVDPPYGIGESSVKNATRSKMVSVKNATRSKMVSVKNYGDYFWDKKLNREQIGRILSMGKDQVIFGGNYYADWLPASMGWIVWDKLNSGDFADCELAWTSYKRAIRKFAYMWNGCFKQHPEERFHPTQKPLALMRWVIENYTKVGDYVVDPMMGSGTTGVACVQTGRKFIGIEIDPGYFEIAVKRIEQAQRQIRMPI